MLTGDPQKETEMNIRRRSFLLGTGGIAMTAGLSACGNSSQPGGTTSDGRPELTYMYRGGEDERAAYNIAIKAFEEANDCSVKVIVTDADQYTTKLQAAITGNQVPDVFYLEQGSVMAFATNHVVRDITAEVEASGVDLDNVWAYGVNSYRFDGERVGQGAMYGMPKDIGPFSFGYNRTMFEAAGIPLPDPEKPYTMDEFRAVAKQLTTDTNGDGELDQWGTGLNVTWNLQAFVWSNGGDWVDEAKTTVTVDKPEFVEALQTFADIQNVDKSTPSIAEAQTLDTYQRWMKGEIGFFPVGPWDVSTYTKLDFDWDLIPYPVMGTGETATWVGSLGIAVAQSTDHPDLAAKLAVYLSTNEEAQRQLWKAGVQVPNLIDMATNEFATSEGMPENKAEFLNIIQETGRALPAATTWSGEWYDEFWVGIQPVLDGKKSAADYCKEVQPRMQEKLDAANQQAEQNR
ncbi:multiple sugar transport system substrate-binding protein [Tessaracoccus bendigoensis DSM 12906]|uniref:Multiple sugar transport system substrate-binding protein n=2 Tax=Tessaracoccus TaxID=72763 RepID=A0A1M6D065_9ACTN|nr:multiple sugar transport system substrate-binding protein [Tessaracoccus bendigoensis DSM 12906]